MIKRLLFILFLSLSTIGFSQEKSIAKLSAAPNPFTTSTKITFNSSTSGTIIFNVKNVLGKTVHKKQIKVTKGKNTIQFYKNNLLTGMYIYTIQNKKSVISKRFVIK